MEIPKAALLLLPLLAPLASCSGMEVKSDVGYMLMQLSGDFGLSDSGNTVTPGQVKLSLGQGLDLDTSDSPYARVDLSLAGWRVSLSGFQYEESGDAVLSANFGNISAGVSVATDITMFNLRGAVTYDLIHWGVLRLSPGVSIDYFDVDLDVNAVSISGFESIDFRAPIPMPYLDTTVELGPLTLAATASGLYANLPDADGTFWDFDAKLSYQPWPLMEMFAGYRFLRLDAFGVADSQDFDTELTMQGWFFGGSFRF